MITDLCHEHKTVEVDAVVSKRPEGLSLLLRQGKPGMHVSHCVPACLCLYIWLPRLCLSALRGMGCSCDLMNEGWDLNPLFPVCCVPDSSHLPSFCADR